MESPFGKNCYQRYETQEITELLPITDQNYIELSRAIRELYECVDIFKSVNPESICFSSTPLHLKNKLDTRAIDADEHKHLTQMFINSDNYLKTIDLYKKIENAEKSHLRNINTAIEILDKFDKYTDTYFQNYLLLDEKIEHVMKYFLNKNIPAMIQLNKEYVDKLKIIVPDSTINEETTIVKFDAITEILNKYYLNN